MDRSTWRLVILVVSMVAFAEVLRYDNQSRKSRLEDREKEKASRKKNDAAQARSDVQVAVPVVKKAVSKEYEKPVHQFTDVWLEEAKPASSRQVAEGPWTVGNCALVTSSVTWLTEWLELQRVSGMGHVWLAPSGITAQQEEELEYYIEMGFVSMLPEVPTSHPGCTYTTHTDEAVSIDLNGCIVPKHCMAHVGRKAKWLLVSDASEYVFPHGGCDITEYVLSMCHQDTAYIKIGWEKFGNAAAPKGLVTASFLSSSGDCAVHESRQTRRCHLEPSKSCSTCRQYRVMYNTDCLRVVHAGDWSRVVNMTDWKEWQVDADVQWSQSPGRESVPMKGERCRYTNQRAWERKCKAWHLELKSEGALFTRACCGAGLVLNKYLPFDPEYRGTYVSTSALRFTRALSEKYSRFDPGHQQANFTETAEGRCFTEEGVKYDRKGITHRSPVKTDTAPDLMACCSLCTNDKTCSLFTYQAQTHACTLIRRDPLIHTTVGTAAERVHLPHHTYASRRHDAGYASGVPLREECRAP